MGQYVTLIAGAAGLFLGWLISGYQRVTEKVIEERRAALGQLLEAVDQAHLHSASRTGAVTVAATRAELLCSPHMQTAGIIPTLVTAVGTPHFQESRQLFMKAARADGTTNSMFLRWWWWRRNWRTASRPEEKRQAS